MPSSVGLPGLNSFNLLLQLHDQVIVLPVTGLQLLTEPLHILNMAFHELLLNVNDARFGLLHSGVKNLNSAGDGDFLSNSVGNLLAGHKAVLLLTVDKMTQSVVPTVDHAMGVEASQFTQKFFEYVDRFKQLSDEPWAGAHDDRF
jgi:hypothetical protein